MKKKSANHDGEKAAAAPSSEDVLRAFEEAIPEREKLFGVRGRSPRMEDEHRRRVADGVGVKIDLLVKPDDLLDHHFRVHVGDSVIATVTIHSVALERVIVKSCVRNGVEESQATAHRWPLRAHVDYQITQHLGQWLEEELANLPWTFWAADHPDRLL